MTAMVATYVAYLVVCVAITIWVANTLKKNGPMFLDDGESTNRDLMLATTHLLIVGFYLINLGVICLILKYGHAADNLQGAVELLSTKVGLILVVLGVVHFTIMAWLAQLRRHAMARRHTPHHVTPVLASRADTVS